MYNNQYNPYMYQNTYIPNNFAQNLQNNVQNSNQMQQLPQKPTLCGKIVDSLEVVKGTEIPLDGSISYFPLADKTAIATKQLQIDGTSKITIYKQEEEKEEPKQEYITRNDLIAFFKENSNEDIEDIKEELKDLKKQIKGLK